MKHETAGGYYGQVLARSGYLQSNACSTPDAMPAHLKPILAMIHPEDCGCGPIAPDALEGACVLDPGLVEDRWLSNKNPTVEKKPGGIEFWSANHRL